MRSKELMQCLHRLRPCGFGHSLCRSYAYRVQVRFCHSYLISHMLRVDLGLQEPGLEKVKFW